MQLRQGLHDQAAALLGQPVVQAGGGVRGQDVHGLAQQHVPSVQARIHLHDGDTRLRITGLDGAMDGRRPPPARQQAGVDVQATQRWQVQHPLGQDQAVGGHHHHVGLDAPQYRLGTCRVVRKLAVQAQAAGLLYSHALLQRILLDG